MTEEEAKTKWCPHVRLVSGQQHGSTEWHTNRPSVAEVHDKGFDLCCGSACMAWRFLPQMYRHKSGYDSDSKTNSFGVEGEPLPREGYCGLAGKP